MSDAVDKASKIFISNVRDKLYQPLTFCMQLTLREKSSAKGKGKQVATFQITLQSSQFVCTNPQ